MWTRSAFLAVSSESEPGEGGERRKRLRRERETGRRRKTKQRYLKKDIGVSIGDLELVHCRVSLVGLLFFHVLVENSLN